MLADPLPYHLRSDLLQVHLRYLSCCLRASVSLYFLLCLFQLFEGVRSLTFHFSPFFCVCLLFRPSVLLSRVTPQTNVEGGALPLIKRPTLYATGARCLHEWSSFAFVKRGTFPGFVPFRFYCGRKVERNELKRIDFPLVPTIGRHTYNGDP